MDCSRETATSRDPADRVLRCERSERARRMACQGGLCLRAECRRRGHAQRCLGGPSFVWQIRAPLSRVATVSSLRERPLASATCPSRQLLCRRSQESSSSRMTCCLQPVLWKSSPADPRSDPLSGTAATQQRDHSRPASSFAGLFRNQRFPTGESRGHQLRRRY